MTDAVVSNLLKLEDFFKNEYIDFSVYDNVRKIASYIDGQKNASRKILHTVLQQNIDKFVKVSNLGPKVQDYAQYLHGSLEGTIVNMTANYVGSGNNLPLLEGDGNFGSAFIPEAAATRYIFARMNPVLRQLFNKDDYNNLVAQSFEGSSIEPRFYVPTLPMIAINGSDGVSIGFAQKILPRNPAEIKKWVEQKATGEKNITADLTPWWKGMTCTVEQGETPVQWIIKGTFNRKSRARINITSLPIGYTLKQYQAVLEKLVEDKVIKDYDDLSDNDVFEFDVVVDTKFTSHDDEWILNKLKLVKKVSENFTCTDENNKVTVFDSLTSMLNAWYVKRIEFNDLRKQLKLQRMQEEADLAIARASFIKGVVQGKIELRNTAEKDVVTQTIAYDSTLEPYVSKFLGLPMRSLTKEEIAKLTAKATQLKKEIAAYKKLSFEQLLLDDISNLTF
jgi:DNA topoisomerase-2